MCRNSASTAACRGRESVALTAMSFLWAGLAGTLRRRSGSQQRQKAVTGETLVPEVRENARLKPQVETRPTSEEEGHGGPGAAQVRSLALIDIARLAVS